MQERKPVYGKNLVYLFRPHSKASAMDGTVMAFVTENKRSKKVDTESTATKDGSIVSPSTMEQEITTKSYMAENDENMKVIEDAMDENELMDIWEANLQEKAKSGENKFAGRYFQGYLTQFEVTSSAEGYAEIATAFAINGKGVKGDVTVTKEQQALADYMFADTPKTGA